MLSLPFLTNRGGIEKIKAYVEKEREKKGQFGWHTGARRVDHSHQAQEANMDYDATPGSTHTSSLLRSILKPDLQTHSH
jgi:hypothetical protein